jgi:3'-phosphoadenosine 5'-phosphosulfate sulfotransferase (PAPS reductase)/FAD synthetase
MFFDHLAERPVPAAAQIKHLKRPHSGCYSLTEAIQSAAATPAEIVAEVRDTRRSERQGRLIDNDGEAAMERKKRGGYF